jgi:hypothetical protein
VPLEELSWSTRWRSPGLAGFRIYGGGDVRDKGQRIKDVPAEDLSATVLVDEGWWTLRVVPFMKDGTELPWDDPAALVTKYVHGRDVAPPTPAHVAIGHVEPSMGVRVAMDVPDRADEPFVVQVIEGGAHPSLGKLVAEFEMSARGPLAPDASRLFTPEFAFDGSAGPTTRTVHVRTLGVSGRPGGYVTRSIQVPTRHTLAAGVAIASVDGATYSGFAAPGSADAHEIVATDGLRLRKFPTVGGSWTGFGTVAAGLFQANHHVAPYVDNAKVETSEIDLGVNQAWVLDIYDEIQRKNDLTGWTGRPMWSLSQAFPMFPGEAMEIRKSASINRLPWLMREIQVDGYPRQPLRDCKWQYVIGASSSVAHADSDYVDYVPGMWVKGRYVRLRLVLEEPLGLHRIVVPKIAAYARPAIAFGTAATHADSEYLALAGRAGGQTAQGGTAASENLTLESTHHATKGEVVAKDRIQAQAGDRVGSPAILAPAQITGSVNNYSPTGLTTARVIVLDLNGDYDITGIDVSGFPSPTGVRLLLVNGTSARTATLKTSSASSTAANRFDIGADFALGPKQSVEVIYLPVSATARWRFGDAASSGGGGAPAAHATSHQNGGTDEVDVTGLSGVLADPQTPASHASDHENGGGDEIDVTGLSGLLADPQTAAAHASSHELAGSDAMRVATGIQKASDTSRSSTTSPAADPTLQVALSASTNYRIRLFALFSAGPGGFKYQFTFGGTTTKISLAPLTCAGGGTPALAALVSAFPGATALAGSGDGLVCYEGVVQVSGSGGTLSFDWAQNSSNINPTKVLAGSVLEVQKA